MHRIRNLRTSTLHHRLWMILLFHDRHDWKRMCNDLVDDMTIGMFSIEQLWSEMWISCNEERMRYLLRKIMERGRPEIMNSL